jgi:MFS family permease
MDRYQKNARWLTLFAPFRALSISAAYLTPFFLQHGLSLSQMFLLQSIFSLACVLWEIPSGIIADRFGRAFSIKLSAPLAAFAMIAYGFSSQFWQFVIWELALAVASGLISGIDIALLLDSLKADGREDEFVHQAQRIDAWGYGATALGVPVAYVLVQYVSISATLIADGLLTTVGMLFAFQLSEAPRFNGSQEALRLSAWQALKELARNSEVRWLIILGSVLSVSTYIAFWLSAPYYQSVGIPLAAFGAILAFRSLWRAGFARFVKQRRHLERNLIAYALLAGLVYFAMAAKQLWLIWIVLGHDAVQALHAQPITAELNVHIAPEYRATLNSAANLVKRLAFTLAGPCIGLLVDHTNLSVGLVVTGIACSVLAFMSLARLHRLGTFQEKR